PRAERLAMLRLQRHAERTMSELAEVLGAPLSTASGIGERLARRGLVHRQRRPEDRRVVAVRLTRKGEAAAGKLRAQIDGLLRRGGGGGAEGGGGPGFGLGGQGWAGLHVPPPGTGPGTAFPGIAL